MSLPKVSVCIPLYQTEPYLERCLLSAYRQSFDSFEIVLVSDYSFGKDSKGRSAKKIVRAVEKEGKRFRKEKGLSPVKLSFIEHSENRGILEVRRTLAFEARGEYIFSLDSDDEILPETLSTLVKKGSSADIIHGAFISGFYDPSGSFIEAEREKCEALLPGTLSGKEIFHKWISGQIAGNLCAKLIRRELILRAFENIPYTECNMADDFLIFFFVSQFAKAYTGLEDKIYRYRINSGMSSARKIDSLEKWRLICSTSSVFAIISQWLKENKGLSEVEVGSIRRQSGRYLANNLLQLEQTVIPSLQQEARKMLEEYWGKSTVEKVEGALRGVPAEGVGRNEVRP